MSAAKPPIPQAFALLAAPLAWAYGIGVALRNGRFDRGLGIRSVPPPVISIGNITAGGTGKTPMVAWIARALRQRGHQPLIAMRGYGSKPGSMGDEEREYRAILDSVEIVAHPQRADAILRYLASVADPSRAPDCILLDDGFQHRQLRRDLDLVLVDATRPALEDRLLPSGWLREPARALARADAVIVTRSRGVDPTLAKAIERLHGKPPLAWTEHAWRSLDRHDRAASDRLPLGWLRGKRVLIACGVGHPASVIADAEASGARVADAIILRDHAAIDRAALERIQQAARGTDAVLVTRKDWVKIELLRSADAREGAADAPPFVVPDLSISFLEGEEALLRQLREAIAADARPARGAQGSPAAGAIIGARGE
jgi:tetraacyldisaccharide 4'-kinase